MVKEEIVAVKVETEIVFTETIKPSSPTPDHLRKFNLSVHDQFTPHIYTPLVLFFAAGEGQESFGDRSRRLRSSLSGALARFYPLAGRVLEDDLYVDCNDDGAEYVEAKVNGCCLSDILGFPDDKVLRKFLPSFAPGSGSGRVLLVQVNAFECGGMTIGVCVSHKITDAFSMSVFLKGWAAVARGEAVAVAVKDLNVIASRFPAIPNFVRSSPVDLASACKCVTRRYVFDGNKVNALKEKSASSSVVKPTRVEAVSALIWKSIVKALTLREGHKTRPSVVAQSVELRKRMDPPLSEFSLGNMVGSFFVEASGQGHDRDLNLELQETVVQLRTKLRDVTEDYVTKLHDDGAMAAICELAIKYGTFLMRQDIDFYIFSSWCRMGLYDADFGFGKAAWIGTINISDVKNAVVLMDTRDGDGIEAIVTLPEKDMAVLETNRELLEFASSNPSVLNPGLSVNDRTDFKD